MPPWNSGLTYDSAWVAIPLSKKKFYFFFYQDFLSQILTTHRTAGEEGRGTIPYSTLPLPPAHEHSDIYLQLYMCDDYHIFLIAPLVLTRFNDNAGRTTTVTFTLNKQNFHIATLYGPNKPHHRENFFQSLTNHITSN